MAIIPVGVNVLHEIGMESKHAAADLPVTKKHPPRFISSPGNLIEPIAGIFVEGFVVKDDETTKFFGYCGTAELSVHAY
jgi:hypothetical protein